MEVLCPFKMASFIQSHIDFNWLSSLEWVPSTSAVLISIKDVYKSYELDSGHTMQSDDGIWMQACFPLRCSQQGNHSARDEEQSFYSARLDSILVSCMKDFWIGKQAMKMSKPRCFIALFIVLSTYSACAIWPCQYNKAGVLYWQLSTWLIFRINCDSRFSQMSTWTPA